MEPPNSALARPFLIATGLTALGTALAYWLVGMPPLLGAEDAAIGFRYARNLAEGHGIVFNPDGERVEGFTSMLWLFISAGVFKVVGESGLEMVLLLLSLATTVFTLTVLLWLVADRLDDDDPAFWVGAAWLATLAGFYFWSALSLMDVAIWAAGLAAFVALLALRLQGRWTPVGSLPLVVVALVLTRPESMLVVPATAVVGGALFGLSGPTKRTVVDVVLTSVFAVAALTVFRVFYFGHPLPNTYYAKVSPDLVFRIRNGIVYLWEYLSQHPLAWLGLVAVVTPLVLRLLVMIPRRFSANPEAEGAPPTAALVSGLVVIGIASVVFGGGDHYQGHRFLQAYLPMAAVPLALGVSALRAPLANRWELGAKAVTVAAVVAIALPAPLEWWRFRGHDLRQQAYDVGLQGRFVGLTLDDVFAEARRPELGLWMVGGAGYAYTGPVKDLLGLNWIAMGMSPGDRKGPRDHAAFNLDVFWSAPPELMIPEPEAVLRGIRCVSNVMGGAMQGVLVTPRFREVFEPVRLRRGDSEPIIAYGRRDWVEGAPAVVERLGWSYCTGENGE